MTTYDDDGDDDWSVLEKLKGEWVGVGSGTPGDGIGSFSFLPEMKGKIYVRRNRAEYPATKDRPASLHEDYMTVYREGNVVRADFIDNEGHVIHYVVTGNGEAMEFISAPDAKSPRFRMRYELQGIARMTLKFDIAQPGKPDEFKNYIEAELRRK